ncbi:MAG TPA: S8 family serine peptidase [Gemmatimonadales bacterium]|nr:S8 family serine peptidase [Gemmatimonadales bacterium]
MRKLSGLPIAVAALGLVLAGCASETPITPRAQYLQPERAALSAGTSYLILGRGNKLPANLESLVTEAGGAVVSTIPAIGVAVATSASPDFSTRAAAGAGIESVAEDQVVQWISPNERVIEAGEVSGEDVGQSSHGNNETFFNLQWAPRAVHAPEAWDAGHIGTGVRVAVLDGGLNNLHIDLNGSVDVAHSRSFVSGFAFNQDVGTFSHATHVAGIIAAQDDGVGTIGIAPGATIIGVKVLHNGSGSFSAVISGMIYAATSIADGGAGANVINMSLGGNFDRQGRGAAQLANALSRAATYAYQHGVTVIASAGNDAIDLDHTDNLITVPAQSTNVISVAATGPVGFAVGYPNGATDFSRPASYTNFGQSAISFAAPGGDFALPGNALCTLPRIPAGTLTTNCWVFDMVISPASINGSNSGYSFAAGTSMAAPIVAGVAALIIEKNGGSMSPAQVKAALLHSADDLGKPGNDDFYGRGFVNAARAVQ